jgi:hypothetical protein
MQKPGIQVEGFGIIMEMFGMMLSANKIISE